MRDGRQGIYVLDQYRSHRDNVGATMMLGFEIVDNRCVEFGIKYSHVLSADELHQEHSLHLDLFAVFVVSLFLQHWRQGLFSHDSAWCGCSDRKSRVRADEDDSDATAFVDATAALMQNAFAGLSKDLAKEQEVTT